MAAQRVGLVAIALVLRGSAMADSEESPQRVKRDDASDERASYAGLICPCTQGCCEQDWIQYKDACYKPVRNQEVSWQVAEDYCRGEEAHLASVHSDEEDKFILHLMGNAKRKTYWLGAKRISQMQVHRLSSEERRCEKLHLKGNVLLM